MEAGKGLEISIKFSEKIRMNSIITYEQSWYTPMLLSNQVLPKYYQSRIWWLTPKFLFDWAKCCERVVKVTVYVIILKDQ